RRLPPPHPLFPYTTLFRSAGSIVVFSSLTPHATKRNTTDDVRKAYILQYCPDGARICRGSPADGPPTATELIGDAVRCFPVVREDRKSTRLNSSHVAISYA